VAAFVSPFASEASWPAATAVAASPASLWPVILAQHPCRYGRIVVGLLGGAGSVKILVTLCLMLLVICPALCAACQMYAIGGEAGAAFLKKG